MSEIEFWHWWVLAAALGALDMVAQRGVFLWLGVAALVVGLVVFVLPDLSWQVQGLVFVGMAFATLLAAQLLRTRAPGLDGAVSGPLGKRYIGQVIVLESPIVGGAGRAFIGDTLWTLQGGDQPAGATVRVTRADGVSLWVESS